MMLNIRNLNKKFGTKPVIKQFSYSFQEGVYGLLGPNGAGKTTLIRCITQLYSVSKETIFFEEIPVEKYKNYLSQIGYLPQKFGLFRDLKVHEMLEMLAGLKGIQGKQAKQEVVRCLALVNLSDRIDSKVKTLSGGMIRRLGIARRFSETRRSFFLTSLRQDLIRKNGFVLSGSFLKLPKEKRYCSRHILSVILKHAAIRCLFYRKESWRCPEAAGRFRIALSGRPISFRKRI